MNCRELLTHERVRHLFYYDAEAGTMTRLVTVSPGAKAGSLAGSKNNRGYVIVKVDNRNYRLHRLAWVWMTGKWPKEDIDHINGDGSDNRWCNLREATHADNQRNRGAFQKSASGHKGVNWDGKICKWRAQIWRAGKNIHLGYFDEDKLDAAADAYAAAARELHGDFART